MGVNTVSNIGKVGQVVVIPGKTAGRIPVGRVGVCNTRGNRVIKIRITFHGDIPGQIMVAPIIGNIPIYTVCHAWRSREAGILAVKIIRGNGVPTGKIGFSQ